MGKLQYLQISIVWRSNMKECIKLLKEYKYRLTKQQYKTLKGQILNGDFNGFRKGLFYIVKKICWEVIR